MSKDNDSALSMTKDGFEAVGSLVGLLRPIARLVMRDYREAAQGFRRICEALLEANGNLSRWINEFRNFDVSQDGARVKFADLVARYEELKTGKGYQTLKFRCSDIGFVYDTEIRGKLQDQLGDRFAKLFPGDKLAQADAIFTKLTQADGELVEFIHKTVFTALDEVCYPMQRALVREDLKTALAEQASFVGRSENFARRLQEMGASLSDLVREFSGLASRPAAV
ncbi:MULTISPECIES: hypothetical protein [unclassified Variovorax]|uniref:hypothetical protein n=1 Tax=unclassified Variovorax TaxID=663243 RepID=UPI003ECED0D2